MTTIFNVRSTLRFALLATFAIAGASQAAQSTGTLTMGATVVAACTVTGSTMSFTAVNALSTVDTDLPGTLTATCTNGSAYTIGMSAGNSGDVSARTMLNQAAESTATLSYVLSSVAYGGTSWPLVGGTGVASGTGNGAAQTIPVYARITGGQNTVIAGTYADTLTATIDF